MKSKIIFCIVMIQCLLSTAQTELSISKPSTLDQLKLNGSIKTIQIKGYSLPDKTKPNSEDKFYFSVNAFHPVNPSDNSGSDAAPTLMKSFTSEYDKEGNCIKIAFQKAYLPIHDSIHFYYQNNQDNTAQLLKGKKNSEFLEGDDSITTTFNSYSYTYTTDGKMLEIKIYEKQDNGLKKGNDSIVTGTIHYQYNKGELLTEKERYDFIDSTYTFQQFNTNKDLVSEKKYGLKKAAADKSQLLSTIAVVYKYKNGIIEEKESTTQEAYNAYDVNKPKGKLVMGFPYVEQLIYSNEKGLTERKLYALLENEKKLADHVQYNREYDANGSILNETKDGQLQGCMPYHTTIRYIYDSMRNCIKKIYHYDNEYDRDFVVETSYTYY